MFRAGFLIALLSVTLCGSAGYHKWVGIFAKECGIRDQKILSALQYRTLLAKIKPWDAKGYHVSDLKYGEGKWVAVMSKGDAVFSETILSDGRWVNFRDKLKKAWKSGLFLVDLEYGMGRWVGVFSPDLRLKSQSYSANSDIDKLDYLIEEWF